MATPTILFPPAAHTIIASAHVEVVQAGWRLRAGVGFDGGPIAVDGDGLAILRLLRPMNVDEGFPIVQALSTGIGDFINGATAIVVQWDGVTVTAGGYIVGSLALRDFFIAIVRR